MQMERKFSIERIVAVMLVFVLAIGVTACGNNSGQSESRQDTIGRSESDIASICPDVKLLDGLSVKGSDVGSAQTEIEEWISNSGILE